eukprot:g26670.t1
MNFFVRQMEGYLDDACESLAEFVGASAGDICFVDNATFGMNIVASSTPLQPGDEVLLTDHEYGAVTRIWRRACKNSGAELTTARLPFPLTTHADVVDTVMNSVSDKTKMIVVSHVTSPTAVTLPVAEICRRARERGIQTCIDGPHALAMLPIDFKTIDCDYYTASCHKWLCAPIDAEERPNRPIPSGRVPYRLAVGIGVALVMTGLTAAAFVGRPAAYMAILLTGATFAYNASLKKTSFGPIAMAVCRFLNVLLGASAISEFSTLWAAPQVNVAAALGVYIVGLTAFAKGEADTSNLRPLVVATLIINAGLCGLLFLGINADFGVGGAAPRIRVASAWFVVVMVIDRYLTQALFDPSPARVQTAVKTMIMWMIPLDATMVYATTGDALLAGGTALLLAPSLIIGRWLYVT